MAHNGVFGRWGAKNWLLGLIIGAQGNESAKNIENRVATGEEGKNRPVNGGNYEIREKHNNMR